jgi:deoxyribodipyrimidine photolyase-like uncharacterized protein
MTSGPHLRLVLPHQLFRQHLDAANGTVFVLIEHDLLFRQYSFHSHKLVLHRASMGRFAHRLSGVFERNLRSRMVVSLLDKMDPDKRREHRRRAEALLGAGQEATRLLRTAPTIAPSDALS